VSGARPIIRISPTQSASRCLKTARVRIVRPMKKRYSVVASIVLLGGASVALTEQVPGPPGPPGGARGPGGGPPGGCTPYASVTAVALGLTLGARSSI
jgi:hypothetical protein